MQVKTFQVEKTGRKILPVRKINHNQGQYKIHHYTSEEIDYFIGVDIETEDVYVVPISFSSKYTSSIGLRALEPYKNNFTQLEPHIGNDMSGGDDIGESLTATAEGTQ